MHYSHLYYYRYEYAEKSLLYLHKRLTWQTEVDAAAPRVRKIG